MIRLGLSTNLSATGQPHPYRLLDAHPGLFDYVEYSAPLSLRAARKEAALFAEMEARLDAVPVLFHPVHLNLYGPELESAQALEDLAEQARLVRTPWVSNDVAWWHSKGRLFPGALYIAPPLDEQGLADAIVHAQHVQKGLGDVRLVLENPVIIAPRGPMHVLDFMRRMHEATGLGLILDVGHLYSHQLVRGLAIDDGLDRFPLEAVVEIHIAGGVVIKNGERRYYADDHPQPIPEVLFDLLKKIVPRASALEAITYEGDGHTPAMALAYLSRIRKIAKEPRNPGIGSSSWVPGFLSDLSFSSDRAWTVFERAFGAPQDADDDAELDYRLAVLAERLDRSLPLTRALVCGTPETLRAFSASPEMRDAFTGRGRELGDAFGRYVRRVVRETNDEVAAMVSAVEAWALEVIIPEKTAPISLTGALVDLPRDLSLLQHARATLDRHQLGRARATGGYALDVDALREVAAQAPPGPWPALIKRKGSRVEIIGLTAEDREVLGRLDALGEEDRERLDALYARGIIEVTE